MGSIVRCLVAATLVVASAACPAAQDVASATKTHVTTLASTPSGSRISVTATDPGGNTSEFSQRLPFSVNVTSGDAGGGTGVNCTSSRQTGR